MTTLEATNKTKNLVVCVANGDGYYELDLVPWTVYEVLPEEKADASMIRVVDETGEDYLYPASYFVSAKEIEAVRPGF